MPYTIRAHLALLNQKLSGFFFKASSKINGRPEGRPFG
jgi:hypothetical protein